MDMVIKLISIVINWSSIEFATYGHVISIDKKTSTLVENCKSTDVKSKDVYYTEHAVQVELIRMRNGDVMKWIIVVSEYGREIFERDRSPLILNVLPFYRNGICKLESFKIPAVQPFLRSNMMKISRM